MRQFAIFEQHITPANRARVYEETEGVALGCLPARSACVFWHGWHFICLGLTQGFAWQRSALQLRRLEGAFGASKPPQWWDLGRLRRPRSHHKIYKWHFPLPAQLQNVCLRG